MKIMIDMGHPAHVHLYKNFIWEMQKKGHEFVITARDKEMTQYLLKVYDIPYSSRGTIKKSLFGKATSLLNMNQKILKVAKKFDPDIMIGVHNPYIAQVGRLLRKVVLTFTDSEPVPIANILTFPFSSWIITPKIFGLELGKKHLRYNGYHELAYLHPNWFKPDPNVLKELNVNKEEFFFILRFISWSASHDVGHKGFNLKTKKKLVKNLIKYGKVFITSEQPLEKELEKYRILIPPEKIHSVLHYSTLLIGDTQTMTTEAALLGTPAIRCNSFVGPYDMANFIELENKYNIIYNFSNPKDSIDMALKLIHENNPKKYWSNKSKKIFKDKIDLTSFMIWLIEDYPSSIQNMKEHPSYLSKFQQKFKL
jgi:predicted glycosyltransferase